jgi:beta propeller repeat protein
MKSNAKPGGMCILTLLLLASFAETFSEFPISTDTGDQYDPALYGSTVVWVDDRNGNEDIYGYNLSTYQKLRITSDPRDQCNPAIYENIVVWQDYRNNNWEIYAYDISEKQEFRVTSNRYNQEFPAIYENIVVWQDDRNGGWDIYGYNLSEKEEFQITNSPWLDESLPGIYGGIVVWLEDKKDCYMCVNSYNLSTEQETKISIGSCKGYPSIYGTFVVWHDRRNNNYDIYGYNLSTGIEFQITMDENDQLEPAIYRNTVVWHDKRNGSYDIYGYNLSEKEEFQITTNPYFQQFPALYEDICVWYDSRHGNSDIYGRTISELPSSDDGDGDELSDNDGDGYTLREDCNDNDPRIHPEAEEPCGEDYNCDGKVIPCTGALEVIVDIQEAGSKAYVYLNEVFVGETDSEGRLTISDLEADVKYTVRVEAEGYHQEEVIIHIDQGMKKHIKFNMERKVGLTMKIKIMMAGIYNVLIKKTEFLDNPLLIRLATIGGILALIGVIYRHFHQSKRKRES